MIKADKNIFQIIKLSKVESTNTYASNLLSEKKIESPTLFYTHSQTKGKGLGLNIWHSEDNKNLLLSLVSFPGIKVDNHFCLSIIVSLAICDYVRFKNVLAKIKWPNDIYYQNKKLAGILIENSIVGDEIYSSIIGVGLNLNQTSFPDELPNPVSLVNITGKTYDIDKEVQVIANIIIEKLNEFKHKSFDQIKEQYLKNLYKLNEASKFETSTKSFTGRIIDIKQSGHIIIQNQNNEVEEYYFKEISFC